MKYLTLAAALLMSSPALAETFDADQILNALLDLGVRGGRIKVTAMSALDRDENGKTTERLSVSFSRPIGSADIVATELTVYETDANSVLVMTYQADPIEYSLVTKTTIIPVNNESAKVIAEIVKSNSVPVEKNSTPALKILAYSVAKISCVRVTYPGAKASCSVTK